MDIKLDQEATKIKQNEENKKGNIIQIKYRGTNLISASGDESFSTYYNYNQLCIKIDQVTRNNVAYLRQKADACWGKWITSKHL